MKKSERERRAKLTEIALNLVHRLGDDVYTEPHLFMPDRPLIFLMAYAMSITGPDHLLIGSAGEAYDCAVCIMNAHRVHSLEPKPSLQAHRS